MKMYDFLLSMWIQGRVTKQQLYNYTNFGFITVEEFNAIKLTSQNI